jgi:hypothetical protein
VGADDAGVGLGVGFGVGLGVGLGVGFGVGSRVGFAVGAAVGAAVFVVANVGSGEAVGVGDAVGVGAASASSTRTGRAKASRGTTSATELLGCPMKDEATAAIPAMSVPMRIRRILSISN